MSRQADELGPESGFTGWGEWDSVYYLLTARCIRDDTAPFINVRRQSVNWTGLRRVGRTWSHGARLMVALAQNLWNSSGHPSVRELVETLDDENFSRVLRAMRIARGWRASRLPRELDGAQ